MHHKGAPGRPQRCRVGEHVDLDGKLSTHSCAPSYVIKSQQDAILYTHIAYCLYCPRVAHSKMCRC